MISHLHDGRIAKSEEEEGHRIIVYLINKIGGRHNQAVFIMAYGTSLELSYVNREHGRERSREGGVGPQVYFGYRHRLAN